MVTQIMISSVVTYEQTRDIDAIVDEGEQGIFINSSRLVDQVLRDARLNSTVMTRIYGLLGKPRNLEPADVKSAGAPSSDKPKRKLPAKKKRADIAQRIADDIDEEWSQLFPHAALAELMLWGIMQGVGIAQVLQDGDVWSLEVWHPWALTWREFEREYFVQTREDSQLIIKSDGNGGYVSDDGTRWVLYTPYGFANAGRRGLLRASARLYLERSWAHRDRARYSEIHGQPMRVGSAPIDATKDAVAEFRKRISPIGAEPVVVLRKGIEGNQWGLELVEAKGTSHELFDGILTQLDKEIATLFLGQSQTTDGQAGLGANELAGEPVRLDIMKGDADGLGDTLRTQYLRPYCQYSYGRGDMAPHVCWHIDPPEDRAKKATQVKDLITGISMAKDNSIPVDERELLEEFGVPAISEAEQAALDAKKAAVAPVTVPPPDTNAPQQPQMPSAVSENASRK